MSKALGHRLTLDSRLGRGSVFKLALPVTHEPVADARLASASIVGQMLGVRVLIIDDDEAVLTGMAQLLQSWGCRVRTATTIDQALQQAQLQVPDAIVSDYRLRSQHTGAQAIAAVRDLLARPVPALMVTGDTAPERLREALASGIPLLHKPVAPEQLYQALTGLLAEKQRVAGLEAVGQTRGDEQRLW